MTANTDRRGLVQALVAGSATSMFGLPLAALAAAAKGGVVVIGSTQRPRHLNSAIQSGFATMSPAAQLFVTPLRMNDRWQPQPYLAKSWAVSDDARSVTLNLNPGARFHDGQPVTAADLAFSVETVRQNHPFKSILAPVQAVVIRDAHTAVIRLSNPHPALIPAMTTSFMPIMPRHIFDDGHDIQQHPRNENPVGSGPFKLVAFEPGAHITMERNEDFFMPHGPFLDKIIFRVYPDPAALLRGLEKGEIDIHTQLASAPDIKRARRMSNVTVQADAAPAIGPLVWVAFNTKNPKLADKRVRQAINYAIDKTFITKTLLGDVHKRSTGPIHSSSPFYKASVNPYELDIEKANTLLDAADKPRNDKGVRMTLAIDSIPGVAEMKTVQQYLVPALAKIGIEVTMRESIDFKSWATRVSSHEFEATLDSVWNWGDPVIGVHRSWLSSNVRKGVIWSNTQSYRNDEVDALLAQAGSRKTLAGRKAAYHRMQELVVDDCPVAFIYELTFHYGINKRISSPPRSVWGMISPIDQIYLKS